MGSRAKPSWTSEFEETILRKFGEMIDEKFDSIMRELEELHAKVDNQRKNP